MTETRRSPEHAHGIKRHAWEEKARTFLLDVFQQSNVPEERAKTLQTSIEALLEREPTRSLLAPTDAQHIRRALTATAPPDDPEEFIGVYGDALQPLIDLRISHAKAYEDAEATSIMLEQGFTPVNERVSYSIAGDRLQLHLAPSFEIKDRIEELYKDALYNVVGVVRQNPNIKKIGGTSWLNATRTYGAMKQRLGFEISDPPKEDITTHHAGETRPLKDA